MKRFVLCGGILNQEILFVSAFLILAGNADGIIQFRVIQSRLILGTHWFIRDYYK